MTNFGRAVKQGVWKMQGKKKVTTEYTEYTEKRPTTKERKHKTEERRKELTLPALFGLSPFCLFSVYSVLLTFKIFAACANFF